MKTRNYKFYKLYGIGDSFDALVNAMKTTEYIRNRRHETSKLTILSKRWSL